MPILKAKRPRAIAATTAVAVVAVARAPAEIVVRAARDLEARAAPEVAISGVRAGMARAVVPAVREARVPEEIARVGIVRRIAVAVMIGDRGAMTVAHTAKSGPRRSSRSR